MMGDPVFGPECGLKPPDYIGEPFGAEPGTQAWVDEAMDRYSRALAEFTQAAMFFAVCTGDMRELCQARESVLEKTGNLTRAKWLQREASRMSARLQPVVTLASTLRQVAKCMKADTATGEQLEALANLAGIPRGEYDG